MPSPVQICLLGYAKWFFGLLELIVDTACLYSETHLGSMSGFPTLIHMRWARSVDKLPWHTARGEWGTLQTYQGLCQDVYPNDLKNVPNLSSVSYSSI